MNTLRYALLIAALVLQYAALDAQSFNFGFKGSINASYFHGDYFYTGENVNLDPKPKLAGRFSAGGFLRYNVTDLFSIQSEVLYTTRGIRFDEKIEINNLPLRLTGNLTLTYVEIPLLFRVNTRLKDPGPTFIPEPGFTFNAFTGGSFAYKTNAIFSGIISGDVFGVNFDERFENRVWSQFADTDISFIVGAGFEYGIKYRFTFDIRYVITLTNIGVDPQFRDEIRNGLVSVFIGTSF